MIDIASFGDAATTLLVTGCFHSLLRLAERARRAWARRRHEARQRETCVTVVNALPPTGTGSVSQATGTTWVARPFPPVAPTADGTVASA